MEVGPIAYPQPSGQGPAHSDPASQAWTLDHNVHVFAQTESRPCGLTAEGERWLERRQTGKVMVVCSCGYSSGRIDHTELKATMAGLAAEHAPQGEREAQGCKEPSMPPPPDELRAAGIEAHLQRLVADFERSLSWHGRLA
ncbi:hypothetical protein [Streptomyces lasalocidi]|uniref:Uncharacterized protein n=1 Tax=Streptomyces lasalocidi TaxID=324833 RepID=A0A4U5W4V2_STRLS|nr:hypothetical protein [Streptomyces lasalocidi]TKS96219.1 hypothetical protein E4U91_36480 [Streptomyces lasalocidi]